MTNARRLKLSEHKRRESHADRSEEFRLRQRRGLNLQANIHRLPVRTMNEDADNPDVTQEDAPC
jgi:hypothetical protein